MTRPLTILSISSALSLLILGGIYYPEIMESFSHKNERSLNDKSEYLQAQSFLKQNQPLKALKIIKKHESEIQNQEEGYVKWLNLLIAVSEEMNDIPQLLSIFNYYPRSLDQSEKAALLIANKMIGEGDFENYELLRQSFKKNETLSSQWLTLDADSLILQGKTDLALSLLNSRYFEGKEDVARLVRLALLNINDHPKIAWGYLDEALQKDPTNSDLRQYRGRLLESANKKEIASAEYQNALKINPQNPELKDQTLEFLIRGREFKQAKELALKSLNPPTLPSIWLKALFLDKAIRPIAYPFNKETAPKNETVQALIEIDENHFWNSDLKRLEASNASQVSFWLRILENLKLDREKDALTLIEFNPHEQELWDPELKQALKQILNFRATHELVKGELNSTIPFFKELNIEEGEKPSASLKSLLVSREGLYAPFLAAGWYEAALKLHDSAPLSQETPQWVINQLVLAYKENRGLKEAIEFLSKQNPRTENEALLANLYLENNESSKAIPILQTLSLQDSLTGYKSAKKLAEIYLKEAKFQEAELALNRNIKLKNSISGQEILARLYLETSKKEDASKIYSAIEKESDEAKSFLAKEAFNKKDYQKALELTDALLDKY
ncbi:MAG: tetratricopeptide repeat protein, partial [Parachlamydiaceae bacterium]